MESVSKKTVRRNGLFASRVASGAAALALVVGATNTNADTIFQTVQDVNDNNGFNEALWGSPAAVPTAGNDYVSAPLVGHTPTSPTTVRTGTGSVATFPGNSLTMRDGTLLLLKATSYTDVNLILENGRVLPGSNLGGNHNLRGNLTVNTGFTGSIESAVGVRPLAVQSSVQGEGTIVFSSTGASGDGSAVFTVNRLAAGVNTFSGLWGINGGTLRSTTAGSLGTGSFQVDGGTSVHASILDIEYAYLNPLASLSIATGGQFALDNGVTNHTFGSVILGGNALAAGTYSFDDLSVAQQAFFIDGNDTFTVIPEPASLALLGLGAALLAGRRKRAFLP